MTTGYGVGMLDYFQNLIANCAVEWRSIPGYEGLYEASSMGLIRSIGRVCNRKDGRKPRYIIERILSPAIRRSRKPYHSVMLARAGKNVPTMVHSAIALAFYGPRPAVSGKSIVIDHINGNVGDNRPCNLRYCTNGQNTTKQSTKTRPWLGVTKSFKKWKAIVIKDGVRHYLGRFDTKDEAMAVRVRKEIELLGEFAPMRGDK